MYDHGRSVECRCGTEASTDPAWGNQESGTAERHAGMIVCHRACSSCCVTRHSCQHRARPGCCMTPHSRQRHVRPGEVGLEYYTFEV